MLGKIIYRSVTVKKSRVAPAFLAMLFAAAVCTALLTVYCDAEAKLRRELRAYGPNLILAARHGARLDSALARSLDRLLSERGVKARAALFYTGVDVRGTIIPAVGADFAQLHRLNRWWKLQGRRPAAGEKTACLVGRRLAQRLGLAPGQKIEARGLASGRGSDLEIAALFESGEADEQALYLELETAWLLSGAAGQIDLIAAAAGGGAERVAALAAEIEKNYPTVRAKMLRQIAESEEAVLRRLESMVFYGVFFVSAITALALMCVLAGMIAERRREMALIKALGARRPAIAALFLGQAALIALAGALPGYLLGAFGARALQKAIFGMPAALRPELFPMVLALSLAVAVAGAAAALGAALRLDPAPVLKGE